jgi:DNA-binding NarL/FixJ family response regulator
MAYRIFVVEDHPRLRTTFAAVLNAQPDMELCGEAGSGEEALEKIPVAAPDLVLVDVSLPGMSGIDMLRQMAKRWPEQRALIVSGHDRDLYWQQGLGPQVKGYIMKDEGPDVMLKAIRQALAG